MKKDEQRGMLYIATKEMYAWWGCKKKGCSHHPYVKDRQVIVKTVCLMCKYFKKADCKEFENIEIRG